MANALETYVTELETLETFEQQNPTLAQQRRALAKPGQRLAEADEVERHRGEVRHNAGMKFLEGIHQEIFDAMPQWKKDLAQKELDELAGKVDDDSPYVPPALPPMDLPAEG